MTVLVLALVVGAVGYEATAGAGVGVGATQTIKLRTDTNISQSVGRRLARGGTPNTTFTISATVATG
ncbi:MAG: hypothetical protein R6X23_15290 [Acidimicrobiia bacterium]